MMNKVMKKWVLFCAAFVMIFATATVSATTTYKSGTTTKTYTGAVYKMYYKGTRVTNTAHPALKINDNIMVPYYYTLVKNGPKANASFSKSKSRLTLTLNSRTVKLYVGKKYMFVNGTKETLNTAPFYATVNGNQYLMVPAKAVCSALNLNYSYSKAKKAVYVTKKATVATASSAQETVVISTPSSSTSVATIKASSLKRLSTSQFIKKLGPIAQANYKKTGVLASVTLAQAINESGWGRSALAQKSNNLFGMKISLSGNTWSGSTWDGKSYVLVSTREEVKNKLITIKAKFRKYSSVNKSISDHSAYLKNAKNGSKKRYAGLTSTRSYTKQLKILQKGGYCTWSGYVSELTKTIKKYNLTKYDVR